MPELIHKILRRGPRWVIRCHWEGLDPRNDLPHGVADPSIDPCMTDWLTMNDPGWYYHDTTSPAATRHKVFKNWWYPPVVTPRRYCDIHVSSHSVVTAFKLAWGEGLWI